MRREDICKRIIEHIWSLELKDLTELTCYKIAEQFAINKNYLSRKFKNSTQMSLSNFIEHVRIKRSEILLETSQELTIDEISKLVGIEKCHQFRKKFKKKNGINPGIYRKLNKK